MGTGTSFRIRITMGTGMGKGTTSLVEPFEKLGYMFLHERRLCRISYRYTYSAHQMVLRKETDIIHLAMGGGGQKSFYT